MVFLGGADVLDLVIIDGAEVDVVEEGGGNSVDALNVAVAV